MSKDDPGHYLFKPAKTSAVGEKSKIPSTSVSGATDVTTAMKGLKLDVAELVSLAQARKNRGYAKRSFNLYFDRCANLIKDVEAQPDSPNLKYLVKENFLKLKISFQKLERAQEQVITACTEEEEEKEMDFFQELFEQYGDLESRIVAANIDIKIDSKGKGEISDEDLPKTPASRKFKTQPDPELPEEAKFLFQALGANYKVTDHITIFDGTDLLSYISFRHSWENCDRALSRQNLTDYEKFIELKKVVAKQALRLIEHLPDRDQSYDLALETLDKVYLNPQRAITQITQKLTELPKQGTTVATVSEFYTEVLSLYNSMQALNLEYDYMGTSLFISTVEKKLNGATLREWCKITLRKKSDSPLGHDCTISDLLDLIRFNLQLSESFLSIQQTAAGNNPSQAEKPKNKSFWKNKSTLPKNFFVQGNSGQNSQGSKQNLATCSICNKKGHASLKCNELKGKSSQQRLQIALDKKLCKLCLLGNHKTVECRKRESLKCSICSKPHNVLLHLNSNQNLPKNNSSVKLIMRANPDTQRLSEPVPIAHLLKAKLVSDNGQSKDVIILMDSGSSVSLIKYNLVQELGLSTVNIRGPRTCELLGGIRKHLSERTVRFQLHALNSDYYCQIQASVITNIGTEHNNLTFNLDSYPYLRGHTLTMPLPREESLEISVLIGEPVYSALFLGVEARCNCANDFCCVTLYNSKLGKYLGGAYEKNGPHFLTQIANKTRES